MSRGLKDNKKLGAWIQIGRCLLITMLLTAVPAAAGTPDKIEQCYDEAQRALNLDRYHEAAQKFLQAYELDRQSALAADALYWQAFALARLGGKDHLQNAIRALELQQSKYSQACTYDDAQALLSQVYADMARLGDAKAIRWIAQHAQSEQDQNLEGKILALRALLEMGSDQALPLVRKILQDRDPHKSELREQALFLAAERGGDDMGDLLLDVAQNDPDEDVREHAVFWLSRVPSPKISKFLQDIVLHSRDPELRQQALVAIAQQGGEPATRVLKDLITGQQTPVELREHAIMLLSRSEAPDKLPFLQECYGRTQDPRLKELLTCAVGEQQDQQGLDWLLTIALDDQQPQAARVAALHWACRGGNCPVEKLAALYRQTSDRQLHEQVIYVLHECKDTEALPALIQIAKQEKDPELRQSAIFWISQQDDPRVEQFLIDIVQE